MKVKGKVIRGHGAGRKLGFPTINIDVEGQVGDLEYGVYGSWVLLNNGIEYKGALHFGERKTFGYGEVRFEIHLIGYDGEELYGEEVEVEIGEKVRGVVKFGSLEELREQIEKDVALIEEGAGD